MTTSPPPPETPNPPFPEKPPAKNPVTQPLQENMTDSPTNSNSERSIHSVLRDIQQGALDPHSLAIEDRRRCVEHLTCEGYSVADIAEILKVKERTIARDRSANRKSNSIKSDENFTEEMVGLLVTQADTSINRIRRITRDNETPPATRIEGEKACWIITREFLDKLQSLGYLPKAPQQILGQITHQIEHLPKFEQMNDEVSRIEIILNQQVLAGEEGKQPLLEQLASVKDEVKRGVLQEQLTSIATHLVEERKVNNDD